MAELINSFILILEEIMYRLTRIMLNPLYLALMSLQFSAVPVNFSVENTINTSATAKKNGALLPAGNK